ncbi:MAG: biotin/lipoyl-containing protein, partial [Flavisolibacter sp.]
MATVDLVMPKMGESIMEATILKWHKQPGDTVKMDETVLEIATDKVDSEVPSTAEGTLSEVLFNVNDVVPIGAVIARIKTGAELSEEEQPSQKPAPEYQPQSEAKRFSETPVRANFEQQPQTSNLNGNRFYSPLVLNIAAQEGVSMTELERIAGTGNEGRVTKKDILDYVSGRRSGGGDRTQAQGKQQQMMIPINKV